LPQKKQGFRVGFATPARTAPGLLVFKLCFFYLRCLRVVAEC
jgi:hypothetical protein